MPRRQDFYEPLVETAPPPEPELPPIRGILAEVPGLYISARDAAALLGRYAEQYHGEGREALYAAAQVFAGLDAPDAGDALLAAPTAPLTPTPERDPAPPVEAPAVAVDPEIARVEVYPDVDGKWHARPVDSTGAILFVTDGSFDRDYVERDAVERWPGVEIFEVADAMGDSIWDEQHTVGDARSAYTGRRRPSPRRLWT